MGKAKTIKITAEWHHCRLDQALSNILKISRSQVQKLLTQKLILRNGHLPKKSGETLRTGDTIVIGSPRAPQASKDEATSSLNKKIASASGLAMTPAVIAQTPDYLVIEKPAGLLVHPTQAPLGRDPAFGGVPTLTAWLVKKFPKIKTVGDDPKIRPGIIHRLDKEASGLMVVAKTQTMFEHLKEQFKKRTIVKEYYALAHGRVAKDWDEINFPIARGENNARMAARPLHQAKYVSTLALSVIPTEGLEAVAEESRTTSGRDFSTPPSTRFACSESARNHKKEKAARTEFIAEKRFANCTLLRVTLHTGRMHQIRVHLLAYNHPIVGDPLYFQKKRKKNLDLKCGRLFLHSTKLGFTDLTGEKKIFESHLPEKLQIFIKSLH